MTRNELTAHIRQKRSYLCVGLDSELRKLPRSMEGFDDPVFEFNRRIIDATMDFCVAYKINTAFYEANGLKGWESMMRTLEYIPETHFTIADAKRGDIGNTSSQYARAFFETMDFDAITVAPYMGEDSVRPFLEYPDKWTIVLGLTSNPGAADFEMLQCGNDFLFRRVIEKVSSWGTSNNLMFVVGATQQGYFQMVRELIPDHFCLVPGVGQQGGSLENISRQMLNNDVGLLVNASRAIIFASTEDDFENAAHKAAATYNQQMSALLP
jgi:orotidine-5'-phosphate decarboxylase